MTRRQWCLSLATVALLAVAVFGWRISFSPLTNWDEGIYADVAVTMHNGGSWWLPSYHGSIFLEKPPLTFWLMNLAFTLFGTSELAVRFFPALAGVFTALVITIWVGQVSKTPWTAILAGALFASGRFVVFHAFRTGDTDAVLVFSMTLALYSYWRAKTDDRWWWLVGGAVGVAMMTKSFVGALPVLIMGIDFLWSRPRSWPWRRILQAAIVLLVIAAPWHIAVAVSHGGDLWHQAIGFNLIERSSTAIASLNEPWWWYGKVVLDFWFPASALLVVGLTVALRRWRDRAEYRLWVVWMLVIFFAFAFAQTKYDHYIQPMYPALVMIVALALSIVWQKVSDRMAMVVALTAGLIVFLEPSRLAHEGFLWRMTPFGWLPEAWTSFGYRLAIAMALGGICWAIMTFVRRGPRVMMGIILVSIFVLSFGWQYSYVKHLPTSTKSKAMAMFIEQRRPSTLDVLIAHQTEPALYFYLDRQPGLTTREVFSPVQITSPLVLTTDHQTLDGYIPDGRQPGYILWTRDDQS